MYMRIMTLVSLAALVLACFLWRSTGNLRIGLQFVVCLGAALVLLEAVRAARYIWASGFLALALLFNPVMPLQLNAAMLLAINLLGIGAFLLAMRYIKRAPREETISIRRVL